MKRALLTLCVVCLLSGGIATVSAGDQDFTLRNQTGYTIDEVYVSAANDNSWGEDILGRDTMSDGDSTDISFSRTESSCAWDLKVVFDDNESAIWKNFNLCEISEITVKYDAKRPTATYK
jgi:hypothetical protein